MGARRRSISPGARAPSSSVWIVIRRCGMRAQRARQQQRADEQREPGGELERREGGGARARRSRQPRRVRSLLKA